MSDKKFEPSEHLTKLKGKDYLEVKFRLIWLRNDCPLAVIETEMLKHDEKEAIVKARIKKPDGAEASGLGSETKADFGDYLEKAETKAIGRALAALGYGTQFCIEFDMDNPDGTPHVVDSPVVRNNRDHLLVPKGMTDPPGGPQPAPTMAQQAQAMGAKAVGHYKGSLVLQSQPVDAKPEHFCQIHKVPFQHHQNEKGEWWSHRLADGKYCNEPKAKEPELFQEVTEEEVEEYTEAMGGARPAPKGDRPTVEDIAAFNELVKRKGQAGANLVQTVCNHDNSTIEEMPRKRFEALRESVEGFKDA